MTAHDMLTVALADLDCTEIDFSFIAARFGLKTTGPDLDIDKLASLVREMRALQRVQPEIQWGFPGPVVAALWKRRDAALKSRVDEICAELDAIK